MRLMLFPVAFLALAGVTVAGYEWRSFPDDPDELALWQDGRQLGNWRISTREYFPHMASGRWGDPCPPPYPPPQDVVAPGTIDAGGTINFGLDLSRMSSAGKHQLDGREVSKAELLQVIGRPQLPADRDWLALTIIGPEAARQKVLSDLQSEQILAPWKDRIKVQDYAPDHWAVRDAGFVTTGQPTIYCQAPDGTVLHRQDEYRGPQALAEVLRKADPSYRPERDPDLNKPLSNVPPWACVCCGVLLYLLWKGDDQ